MKRIYRLFSGILLFLLVDCSLQAQDFQQFASFYKNQNEVLSNRLNFRFESLGFFWNNEYAGEVTHGYTLTGALVRPKLTYSPIDGLYVEAGAHMIKYDGKDHLQNTVGWFSARYCFSKQFSAVVGNLDVTNLHNLPEQLWEPERIYTDKPEAGLQFLYSGEKLNAQTWVSWEQFIQKNDTFQEKFTAGVTGNYKIIENKSLTFKVPVNLLFYHQGGEINVSPDGSRPQVQTHANLLAGGQWTFNLGEKIKTLSINGYWIGYKTLTEDSNTWPFDKGHACLVEVNTKTKCSSISLSYWNAHHFIAHKGRLLYQSVSDKVDGLTFPNRSMLSANYFWQKTITRGARVAFQVEAYNDLSTNDLSYSYGFFILLNSDFLLKKF
jgi:hypothetical protein